MSSTGNDKKAVNRLTRLAMGVFFDPGDLDGGSRRAAGQIQRAVAAALASSKEDERRKILDALERMEAQKAQRAPPFVVRWLGHQLSTPALAQWAQAAYPKLFAQIGADAMTRLISEWVAGQKLPLLAAVHKAGVRYGVGAAKADDEALFSQSLGQLLSDKEDAMAGPVFKVDLRGTPANFIGNDAYVEAVNKALKENFGTEDPTTRVAITGILLLGENFDPKATGFGDAMAEAWLELLKTTKHNDQKNPDGTPKDVPNRDIFKYVMDNVVALTNRNGGSPPTVFFQEVAFAARYAIQNAAAVPFGHPNFSTQVRIGLDKYVAGTPLSDSLVLPPLTGEFGEDEEIEPDNIRAVGLVYAAYQLEEMRLIPVVDRIVMSFNNGLIPVVFDAGGRALDAYYWDRDDRMTEAERRSVYSRVLGVPGGDVSKEAIVNSQFNDVFIRFLASLAELHRQESIADIVESRRPRNLTAEYVRKAGRDLASNTSVHGFAGTQAFARRLNTHLATALDILKQPSIQKAYGVNGPYQLVETVASQHFGHTPNVVKFRTMAESGKKLLDLVAKYARAWTSTSGKPLFEEDPTPGNSYPPPADIPRADRDAFFLHTQFWLAVNGIKDDQVDKLSEPEAAFYAPSTPIVGRPTNGHGGNEGIERIKQMVSQGQVPTLDQLQQIITGGSKIGA
jgi:hypothetical protein